MLSIYRAIKTNVVGQSFGENKVCVKLDDKGVPIRPFVVQTFPIGDGKGGVIWDTPSGWVKFYTAIGMLGHNGYDQLAWRGEPIYFNVVGLDKIEGTCKTEIDPDGGKGVDVFYTDPDNGKKYKSRFWHLQNHGVYDGQKIMSGDLIGWADSTGASTGDHLHEGFKPVDANGNNLYPDNGFYGCVNPATTLDILYSPNDFVLTMLNLKTQLSLLQRIIKLLYLLKR